MAGLVHGSWYRHGCLGHVVLFMGRGFDTVVLFMGHGIDVVCTGLFLFLLLSV